MCANANTYIVSTPLRAPVPHTGCTSTYHTSNINTGRNTPGRHTALPTAPPPPTVHVRTARTTPALAVQPTSYRPRDPTACPTRTTPSLYGSSANGSTPLCSPPRARVRHAPPHLAGTDTWYRSRNPARGCTYGRGLRGHSRRVPPPRCQCVRSRPSRLACRTRP